MDKTKKMIFVAAMLLGLFSTNLMYAQSVAKIDFCDREYDRREGKDSITLFFNLINKHGVHIQDVGTEKFKEYLEILEGDKVISQDCYEIKEIGSENRRIPSVYTFSVLVDLSIPKEGKGLIYDAVGKLIESAPDSCVYLSFFGDSVTTSELVSGESYKSLRKKFDVQANNKCFYGSLYAKLIEFSKNNPKKEEKIAVEDGYSRNVNIAERASKNRDKNILFVFVDGDKRAADKDSISSVLLTDYQCNKTNLVPKVMALYYTEDDEANFESILKMVCNPRDGDKNIEDRQGKYFPSNDMKKILSSFEEVVNDAKYDYAFKYKVNKNKKYSGKVKYSGRWTRTSETDILGKAEFNIGSPEQPWPVRVEDAWDVTLKYLYALLVTLGTIVFFFAIAKILVPFVRSKSFAVKYYKKYTPEANVSRRICHYCKQDIQPGQFVVTKCKHIMHVFCWQQNGYKCAEYGQNCKIGIQSHVEWSQLFTLAALKDCYQAISGILAGFISWILYELFGGKMFDPLSEGIVNCFKESKCFNLLHNDCVAKVSAFIIIGLLLGFFLSLIFRYNDEYKKKDIKVWAKIVGLSVVSGGIGMAAFALGAYLMCLILFAIDTTFIPWYCSLPAYLLFSVSVSLALTIKSTIPVKSALLGGLCSAVIGFVVLYTSSMAGAMNGWMNMLLDFIIYGGGLGASLVTVRMLAEKYFLVIQNGVRAGQRIPIHKWMNATGGGNKVTIGMTGECEIQMNWEKSNKVAKEHAQLFVDYEKQLPMLKPLAPGVVFNTRAELPVGNPSVLSNGDTFKIGDTIFLYQETE